ncbi:hypothetical protein BJV77DRAFT_1089054 [Russula vinacea]|nr:hypothetical protein BJV77DRAFT_1089054 [Russula vinacea]
MTVAGWHRCPRAKREEERGREKKEMSEAVTRKDGAGFRGLEARDDPHTATLGLRFSLIIWCSQHIHQLTCFSLQSPPDSGETRESKQRLGREWPQSAGGRMITFGCETAFYARKEFWDALYFSRPLQFGSRFLVISKFEISSNDPYDIEDSTWQRLAILDTL